MANPARKFDERPDTPSALDPLNPVPPLSTDPLTSDPRYTAANDPRFDNTVVQQRGTGNGVLIACLVIVLAVIAYFIFAPGTPTTTTPVDQPATTTEPVTPTPDAMAPAAPADTTGAAPATQAPAETAPAPNATAPADTAPATPAPAPAQ